MLAVGIVYVAGAVVVGQRLMAGRLNCMLELRKHVVVQYHGPDLHLVCAYSCLGLLWQLCVQH
jgi:hypothetical protein